MGEFYELLQLNVRGREYENYLGTYSRNGIIEYS